MPLPIRCFTCGRLLGNRWQRYFSLLQQGVHEKDAMDQVGVPAKMYCCRALMITTVDDSEKYVQEGPNPSYEFRSETMAPDKKARDYIQCV